MGADFVALIPSDEGAGMSYSYVHVIRGKLIKMVDKELGEYFGDLPHGLPHGTSLSLAYDKVIPELKEMVDASGDDIIRGVLAFVNHSDCDGDFYDDDCECILKALKKLAETDDDEVVENLIKVFDDAVSKNGIVVIW